jgi:hypothetical protein
MITEYFIGFLIAFGLIILLRVLVPKIVKSESAIKIKYSQSHIHDMIKDSLPDSPFLPIQKPRQTLNHEKSVNLRVLFIDKEAYWIKENKLFIADHESGVVKEDTARRVDTMGMNRVQLDKVIYIVDVLNEGNENDRGYPGNKGF